MAQLPAFTPCASPYVATELADGPYVFQVAAVSPYSGRDATPATREFRVDTAAPRTAITAGPGDTTATAVDFVFSSNESATFSCRLNRGRWEPCSSPHRLSGLRLGPHELEVRATDRAGNVEASPARHLWEVLKPGMRIPATGQQAVALAQALVKVRRAFERVRLRRIAVRRAVRLAKIPTLTAGTVDLDAKARVARRVRGAARRVPFASGRREVPAAGVYPLKVRLTRAARRLARRRPTVRVELKLAFTDLAGRSLWAVATATLKR